MSTLNDGMVISQQVPDSCTEFLVWFAKTSDNRNHNFFFLVA